jgi:hypothetical protein
MISLITLISLIFIDEAISEINVIILKSAVLLEAVVQNKTMMVI